VSPGWVAYWRACYTVAHHLRLPGFRGHTNPYIVVRCPVPKRINYELSPVPYQDNVVAWKKLVWRTLIHNALFLNPPPPFSSIFKNLIFKSHFKIHQWNSNPFQGFSKSHLSVPNLEFLLHYKVFQRSRC
jgi:hypothetical protein